MGECVNSESVRKDRGLPFLTFSHPKSLETNREDGLRQPGK